MLKTKKEAKQNYRIKFIENNAKFQRTKRYLTSTLP